MFKIDETGILMFIGRDDCYFKARKHKVGGINLCRFSQPLEIEKMSYKNRYPSLKGDEHVKA